MLTTNTDAKNVLSFDGADDFDFKATHQRILRFFFCLKLQVAFESSTDPFYLHVQVHTHTHNSLFATVTLSKRRNERHKQFTWFFFSLFSPFAVDSLYEFRRRQFYLCDLKWLKPRKILHLDLVLEFVVKVNLHFFFSYCRIVPYTFDSIFLSIVIMMILMRS